MDIVDQYVVVVVQQVMGGNGCVDVGWGFLDELGGVVGGDVFEDYFQGWEVFDYLVQVFIDELFFMIEYVDFGVGYFVMYQQWYVDFGYCFECFEDIVDVGYVRV